MAELGPVFHNILTPTDGSQPSMQAGKLAIRLAAFHQARLTFIYVVDDVVTGGLSESFGKAAKQVESDLESSGRRYLDYLCRLATASDVSADQVIRKGNPYQEIANFAREQQVDLIIIGQVGSRGLRRILIGSVTERVIEYAACPVLVVK
jgi:nucleotide-binding universal stress UspA family protein